MIRLLPLLAAVLLAPSPVAAQQAAAAPLPPLAADLSTDAVEITTGFTGASVLVFGSTDRLIGPGGDQILVVAWGPPQPMVVRRKIEILGFWINGPAARFPEVPGFYAVTGTRPAWELLPEPARQAARLGLDTLPLRARGEQGPAFRAALLKLRQEDGRWQENTAPVEIVGGRLFYARLPLPATVPTGDYRIQVLLVRDERIVARQELALRVERVGSAARISDIAEEEPVLYGAVAVFLAAFAGWLGSVLFRRS